MTTMRVISNLFVSVSMNPPETILWQEKCMEIGKNPLSLQTYNSLVAAFYEHHHH